MSWLKVKCSRCERNKTHETTVYAVDPEGRTIHITVAVCGPCRGVAARENTAARARRGAGQFRGVPPWR